MTHTDAQVLAALEQQAIAEGAALEDLDAYIADALGVPADYYFAYRLVTGAIEAYRRPGPAPDALSPQVIDGTAAELVEGIAWRACRIYQHAGRLDAAGVDIALAADDLLGDLAALRQHLSHQPRAGAPTARPGMRRG